MAKISVDLSDTDTQTSQETADIDRLAMALPSSSRARRAALSAELRAAPRVQFAFSQVPKPIKDKFVAAAKERGITMKELLYDCLRAGGIDIPISTDIDRRRFPDGME
ncbi:MAG: hypothetical protein OXC53_12355 [Rhodobacteraceae bacterium]|nr:hypothetical protein [Paracoccaceae bacterium]